MGTTSRGTGREPSGLKWTWMFSGVYSYTTPTNTNKAFATPMCTGGVNTSKEIDEQAWVWDDDNVKDPGVRTKP